MEKINKEIKVSIIIPVYNVAAYVEECIQSVLNQDYENIEIIIVDDCGTDNSMELVRKMIAGTSKEIHILKHDHNRGFAAGRNTGIKNAVGNYIYFLDSDDYIEPDCISRLVKVAHTYLNPDLIVSSSKDAYGNKTTGDISDVTDLKEYYDNSKQIKKWC